MAVLYFEKEIWGDNPGTFSFSHFSFIEIEISDSSKRSLENFLGNGKISLTSGNRLTSLTKMWALKLFCMMNLLFLIIRQLIKIHDK